MTTEKTGITTETAADGTEFVSEMSTTITEMSADGTETVAEVTTTQGDTPSDLDSTITITEIAPDGTETVTEYATDEAGELVLIDASEEHESLVEEVVEAIFDVEVGEGAGGSGLSADEASDDAAPAFV
ncbi:MAG TPA: hypothetical protein VNM67_22310, partial [Thermoanaerobaculia bacterium]|nr:hypothetical protein [Thermoanaerobaculia bacterium]